MDIDLDNDKDLIVGGSTHHRIYINDNNNFEETDGIHIPYLGKDVKFSSGNLFASNHFDIISGIRISLFSFSQPYTCASYSTDKAPE